MATNYINNRGRSLGRIDSNGHMQYAFDANGHKVGWYDGTMDQTYTADGHFYGCGNLLRGLL